MLLPNRLISFVSFPGVILHEITHRFFCDIAAVHAYNISSIKPFFAMAGCIKHESTINIKRLFFISMGPLIINSVVCMLLTFPYGTKLTLGTDFVPYSFEWIRYIDYFALWMGLSAGYQAMPSNNDIDNILGGVVTEKNVFSSVVVMILSSLRLFNIRFIGYTARLIFAGILMRLLPFFIFGEWYKFLVFTT